MIDFKNKGTPELMQELYNNNIEIYHLDGSPVVNNPVLAQDIIDKWKQPMPDLNHRQMVYFLAFTGLDDIITTAIAGLRVSDKDKYADIKAQFFSCYHTYRYSTIFNKLTSMRVELLLVSPTLSLSETTIKAAWNRAKLV